eukprot:9949021-Alexandrium_andersonii.AAC.1
MCIRDRARRRGCSGEEWHLPICTNCRRTARRCLQQPWGATANLTLPRLHLPASPLPRQNDINNHNT